MRPSRMPTSATACSDCDGSIKVPPLSNRSNGIRVSLFDGVTCLGGLVISQDHSQGTNVVFSRGPRGASFCDAGTKLAYFPCDADFHFDGVLLVRIENLLPVPGLVPY